jgi:phosphoglycolate phosphatase
VAERWPLIVFDWDGTLMDSTQHIVDAAMLTIEELGLDPRPPEAVRAIIGLGLRESWSSLYPDLEDPDFQAFTRTYRRHFFSPELYRSTLYPGVQDMLLELRERGYRLAVATGKGRPGLDRDLDRTGLGPLFTATRTADESRSKPSPDMLFDIYARTGSAPAKALVIGDTEFDVEMARRAGSPAVGVAWGAHPAERLLRAGVLALLEDLTELPAWLDEQREEPPSP